MGEREVAGLRQACDSACTMSMVSALDRYRPLGAELVRRGQESPGTTGIATNEMEGVEIPNRCLMSDLVQENPGRKTGIRLRNR